MYEVSQAWKDMQASQLVGEGFVEVSFAVGDPDAQNAATASDNGHMYISDVSVITDENQRQFTRYCTLEQDLWQADGSLILAPNSAPVSGAGFVGNVLSGADGSFAVKPTITITLDQVYSKLLPGISITWSKTFDEWATSFSVSVNKNGATIFAFARGNNTAPLSVITHDIPAYDQVVIKIHKWSKPLHYARVENILLGIKTTYDKGQLMAFEHERNFDPICASAPVASITFSLDNTGDEYDPNNDTGMSKYLMERQRIRARYGFKLPNGQTEWIPAGLFYLSEWNAPQNGLTASFKARDIMTLMQGTYSKGVYSPGGVTLKALAEAVLNDANLPPGTSGGTVWQLDEALSSMTTTAPLPLKTHAECLQYIAQAAGMAMWHDRSGVMHIGTPGTGVDTSYKLNDFNLFSRPEIELQTPVSTVRVHVYNYTVQADDTELYKGTLTINGTKEITVSYSQTAASATATVTGGTLVSAQYFASACMLKITASGDVNIAVTGKPLASQTANHDIYLADDGSVQEVDNPLITDDTRAEAVAQWAGAYLKARRQIKISSWRADPRLDALDIVPVANKHSEENVRISRVKYSFKGAFRGDADGRVTT